MDSRKIRYYGIVSTRNRKDKLAKLQSTLGGVWPHAAIPTTQQEESAQARCPACGKSTLCRITLPAVLPKSISDLLAPPANEARP